MLGGGPDALAAGLASKLLTAAPVVVVGSTGSRGGLSQAAAWAEAAHAPLLLTSPQSAKGQAALREEVSDLHPDAVLAAGVSRTVLARQLGRVRVVSRPAGLPSTRAPVPAGARGGAAAPRPLGRGGRGGRGDRAGGRRPGDRGPRL